MRDVLLDEGVFIAAASRSGDSMLPRTIVISIVNFKLFDCPESQSLYQAMEVKRHTVSSDKMGLYFFKLPKLPEEIREDNRLLLWLTLFKAETEEELEKSRRLRRRK